MTSLFPPLLKPDFPSFNSRSEYLFMDKTLIDLIAPKREEHDPMIICPGLGGTCLDYTISSSFSSPDCNSIDELILKELKILWFNPIGYSLIRPCFLKLLSPVYNSSTKILSNYPNVNVFVHGSFDGDVLACKCLTYL